MHELDQRDRDLLAALQAEIPLVSTPFAFIGQTLDMSEKEVIKRTERLRRDGLIRHIGAQFDPRSLGYRSCLVAARVPADRVDDAVAVINAHPGVTQNYLRNNDLNLWFTLFVSPDSALGLEKTVEVLGDEAGCEVVRQLPTLKLFKSSAGEVDTSEQDAATALTPLEIECVRLLQNELPLQPRPFDSLTRGTSVTGDELLATARTMLEQGRIRRMAATVPGRKSGFTATAMGLWAVPHDEVEKYAAKISQNKAVSHCYLRPVYDDWPYNLYTTVHGRSVDECESIINDIAIDTGLTEKKALYPTREFKKSRVSFFSPEAEEWESAHSTARAAAAG